MSRRQFEGVFISPVTSFNHEGVLDYNALEASYLP